MVHERLENTEEMLAVAAEMGNQELAFLAHNARFHCLLELCDGPGIDTEIAALSCSWPNGSASRSIAGTGSASR